MGMEIGRLAVGEYDPGREEQPHDYGLSERDLGLHGRIEHVRPVLGGEDLIHGQEGVEQVEERDKAASGEVWAKELDGHQRSENVDDEQEEAHVQQTVHVSKNGQL